MSIERLASIFISNWKRIDGFSWFDSPSDKEEYGVYHLDHKCSSLISVCNSYSITKRLDKFSSTMTRDVIKQVFVHYGVGWMNAIAIRVYVDKDHKLFTSAFREFYEITDELKMNGILDKEYYDEKVVESTRENIEHLAYNNSIEIENSGWVDDVYEWFSENNKEAVENREDRGGRPTLDELKTALMELGYKLIDEIDIEFDEDEDIYDA